jgi:aminoglycoside phosphotransferase (APT) family kinase protein
MEDKIKQIIERELNAETLEIKRITEGYSHHMYLVKIDKKPFEVIVRFSNNKDKTHGLGKEKYVIETLQKNNIPAPKIFVFHEDYMILEKFNGIRLDTVWDSLPKSEKIQITEELGKLLSKIHSIKLETFGEVQENGHIKSDMEDTFKFRKEGEPLQFNPFLREVLVAGGKDFSRLIAYKHLTAEFVAEYIKYLYKNLDKIDYEEYPVLCHGDFHQGHIFIEKTNDNYKIIGLIDFEFARAYPPEYDLLKLHRNGFFDDPELKQALIKGYGKINESAVEIHRLIRDMGFAQVMLDAGNRELSNKTLEKIKQTIGFQGNVFI